MNPRIFQVIFRTLVCLVFCRAASSADAAAPVHVGVSRVDVTPTHPVLLAGYGGRTTEHEGVDTPLWARAMVIGKTKPAVIVALDNHRFRPAEVVAGDERNGRTVILDGLAENERVVVSGQFLIDSEASLRGAFGRMSAPAHAHSSGEGP